jgi:hypothetical protein
LHLPGHHEARSAFTVDPEQFQVTIREMLFAMSQRPRIRLPQMIT